MNTIHVPNQDRAEVDDHRDHLNGHCKRSVKGVLPRK